MGASVFPACGQPFFLPMPGRAVVSKMEGVMIEDNFEQRRV